MNLGVDFRSFKSRKKIKRKYWKLNVSILNDSSFYEAFSGFWESLISHQEDHSDVAEWWDHLVKPKVKEFCIGFSIFRRQQRLQTKQFLFSYLKSCLNNKDWDEIAM